MITYISEDLLTKPHAILIVKNIKKGKVCSFSPLYFCSDYNRKNSRRNVETLGFLGLQLLCILGEFIVNHSNYMPGPLENECPQGICLEERH